MIPLALLTVLGPARAQEPPPVPVAAPPATVQPAPAEPASAPPATAEPATVTSLPGATKSARDLYLQALKAWKRRDFEQARDLCKEAVSGDPLLTEAWLLRSYAHQRLREPALALASVRIARESDREDVRAAARSLEARLTQDDVRDSPSAWAGGGPLFELIDGDLQPRVVLNLGVGVPLWERLTGRAEVRWTAFDPGELRVAGTRASAMAAWTVPLGSGRWSFTPSAGPSLWIATGQYWADGVNPYLGIRADLDLDTRLTPALGFYAAVGTEIYPGQIADLRWLYEPLEARVGMRLWFWRA